MIGNDIIDLKLAKIQSNWQRKGFLEKQFADHEVYLIHNSKNPSQMVWRLWSMKEAAYKAVVQQLKKRFFAPKKFECQIISSVQGKVRFENREIHVRTEITSEFIYTVTEELSVTWNKANNNFSFFQFIERQTGFSSSGLNIKKDAIGIPHLYYQNQRISSSLSKTHHGRFEVYEYNLLD